jgi:hypothetical protein
LGSVRGILQRAALFGLAFMMASCGGGVDDQARGHATVLVQGARVGFVYPPVQGLTFSELDETGEIRQESSSTDASGHFRFPKSIIGARVIARVERPLRQPLVLSARLAYNRSTLAVTPLTTVFDHLVETGISQTEAESQLKGILSASCKGMHDALPFMLYGDTAHSTIASHQPILHSVAGFLTALRQIGLGLDALVSSGSSSHRAALLGRMCSLSQHLLSPTGTSETRTHVAKELGLLSAESAAAIPDRSPVVLDHVLRLMASEMPVLEHQQVVPVLGTTINRWKGREESISRTLALAVAVGESDTPAGRTAIPDAALQRTKFRRGANYALDESGMVVESIVTREEVSSAYPADARPLFVRNTSAAQTIFNLDLNGAYFHDVAAVVRAVIALPPTVRDEPLFRRAWRFVTEASEHGMPVTGGRMLHVPEFFLRSIGSGFCDDRATVLMWTWKALGYEARVWGLEGHVVPEVMVGQRWKMLDPDLGAYYMTKGGAIAGVEELQAEPSLITDPEGDPFAKDGLAYSTVIADYYATVHDNAVSPWFSYPHEDPPQSAFALPAGSRLEVDTSLSLRVSTIEFDTELLTSRARLWIPSGFSGVVPLPLLLVNIKGDAQVRMLGSYYQTASVNMQELISAYYREHPAIGIGSVEVQHIGPEGLCIEMAVSPRLLQAVRSLEVQVTGLNLHGVEVEFASRSGE